MDGIYFWDDQQLEFLTVRRSWTMISVKGEQEGPWSSVMDRFLFRCTVRHGQITARFFSRMLVSYFFHTLNFHKSSFKNNLIQDEIMYIRLWK